MVTGWHHHSKCTFVCLSYLSQIVDKHADMNLVTLMEKYILKKRNKFVFFYFAFLNDGYDVFSEDKNDKNHYVTLFIQHVIHRVFKNL